jgi:hypothetical protein
MKRILFISGILSVLFSCTKTKPLVITLPETEKKLCVSSVVIPGNVLAVSLSYSFSALINSQDSFGNSTFDSSLYNQFLVSRALVTISYNGQTDTLYKIVPGVYGSANILQVQNATYALEVYDSATELRVSAHSTMLARTQFDSLYFTKTVVLKDTLVDVHFSVNDNTMEENYYMVSYYNVAASPVYSALFGNPGNDKFIQVDLYSDKVVNAQGKIKVDKTLFVPDLNDTMVVELANISKGYYEFLTAYKKSDQLIYQLLGEPVTLPTNVVIGYGYFSTYNPSFRFVDLSKL